MRNGWIRRGLTVVLTVALLLVPCWAPGALAQAEYDPTQPELLESSHLDATSAILIEASSGEVIFEKDADMMMYPASTTKILTLLLGIMMGDLSQTVYLSETAANVGEDSSVIGLDIGESILFEDLLYATMIRSGNEGANLIAETISGSIPTFVDLMNEAAALLGCTSTHFANPHGLHDDNHYTTARDMALIAKAAMENELFRDMAKAYTYTLPRSNLHSSRVLTSTTRLFMNPSLDDNEYYYPGAIGIKSGNHSQAGYCFVGAAERDGVELISVVFNSTQEGRWTDTQKLMDYGFTQFVSLTPMELYALNPIEVEAKSFSLDDPGYGRLRLDLRTTDQTRSVQIVATKEEAQNMSRNLRQTVLIQYSRDFSAPITQGETMGTMTYYPNDGGSAIVYELVASRSVERREDAPLSLEEIETMVYADPNPFPPFTLEMALYIVLPLGALLLILRLMGRLFHRSGRRHSGRIPKPRNRFYR